MRKKRIKRLEPAAVIEAREALYRPLFEAVAEHNSMSGGKPRISLGGGDNSEQLHRWNRSSGAVADQLTLGFGDTEFEATIVKFADSEFGWALIQAVFAEPHAVSSAGLLAHLVELAAPFHLLSRCEDGEAAVCGVGGHMFLTDLTGNVLWLTLLNLTAAIGRVCKALTEE